MIQTSLSAPIRAVNGTVTPSWLPLPLIMAITSCNPCSLRLLHEGRTPFLGLQNQRLCLGPGKLSPTGQAAPPTHWTNSGTRCPVPPPTLKYFSPSGQTTTTTPPYILKGDVLEGRGQTTTPSLLPTQALGPRQVPLKDVQPGFSQPPLLHQLSHGSFSQE